MRQAIVLVALLTTGVTCRAFGLSKASKALEQDGDTFIAAQSAGHRVTATIRTRPVRRFEIPKQFRRDFSNDVSVVSAVDIRVNGNHIFVLPDAYCWLVDPRQAELDIGTDKMSLSMEGGDAGTYYTTSIEF